jgi:hypothetical protein
MKRSYTFFVLCLILLTACTSAPLEPTNVVGAVVEPPTKDAGGTLSSPVMDAQTNTPNPTGTTVPTATVLPTATEAPTATIDVETKTNEEIIARMNQFLNAEGDYSDENLNKVLLDIEFTQYELKNNLGLVFDASLPPDTMIQNLLLGYKMDQGNTYFVLGNEDKKGNRFVYFGYFPQKYDLSTGGGIPVFEHDIKVFDFQAFKHATAYRTDDEIKGL